MRKINKMLLIVRSIVVAYVVFISEISHSDTGAAMDKDLDLDAMTECVENNNLQDFMSKVHLYNWSMPEIYSAWYVEHMPENSPHEKMRKRRCFAARAIGRHILSQLNESMEDVDRDQNEMDNEDRVQFIKFLIDLKEWTESSVGYGNFILAIRCEELASVELAYLAVDLHFMLDTIEMMSARSESICHRQSYKRNVLIREMPMAVDDDLASFWRKGRLSVYGEKNASEKVIAQKKQTAVSCFIDDRPMPNGGMSSLAGWDLKYHERLTQHTESYARNSMLALVEYRKAVGMFPQKVPYDNHPFYSDGMAAFEYAWRPFASEHNRNLYATAWVAYDTVRQRKMVASESSAISHDTE